MDTETLRVGIAGYGVVGRRRRVVIDQHPRLRTVAVCDQDLGNAGSTVHGLKCFSRYDQLLKEPLDILFVCLPTYLAAEVTIAGLERDLHVFCEKPPGTTPDEVERVIKVEQEHPSSRLKYGFNHRFHDSVRRAQKLIDSGDLGDIINIRGVYGKSKVLSYTGSWRAERRFAGGGILLDQGIHLVDLMRLFCGEFVEVKSFISNCYWKYDVEDNAYAIMRDERGRIAMLHSSATQWQHRFSLDVALTNGFITLRGILSGSKSYGQEELVVGRRNELDVGSTEEEVIRCLEDNSWSHEVNEFAEAILEDRSIEHGSSMDALETMRLVYRIYSADESWRNSYGLTEYR